MKREVPILFSAPMVRAILAGRKTQTRRLVKLPPPMVKAGFSLERAWPDLAMGVTPCLKVQHAEGCNHVVERLRNPWGWPEPVRLWVRETWCADGIDDGSEPLYHYRADADHDPEATWRPSIFMPRAACRIVLDVVAVRAERLQDISEADAIAEGICKHEGGWGVYNSGMALRTARNAYRWLWGSINGKRAPWDANPWVWVVEFEVAS